MELIPLCTLLEPWIETLRELRIQPTRDNISNTSSSHLWLEWTLPPTVPSNELSRQLEAIEVFVLLAWANHDAWRNVVQTLCADKTKSTVRDWETLILASRRVNVVGYDIVCTDSEDAQGFLSYLSSPPSTTDGFLAQYHAVRRSLEAANPDHRNIGIPVRLRLQSSRFWRGDNLTVLPTLLILAKLQKRVQTSSEECRLAQLRSRIHTFYDDIPSFSRVDESILHQMTQIWSHGIGIYQFPQLQLKLMSTDRRRLYANALQTLFGIGQEGSIRFVDLGLLRQPIVTPTLLSALVYSPTVQEINLDFDGLDTGNDDLQTTRLTVQWMAFVLFSPQAENAIAKVSMHCKFLTMDHVTTMRDLLSADDPLVVIYPEFVETIQSHNRVRVSASHVLLEHPSNDSNIDTTPEGFFFRDMRVLGHENGWCMVLLPGWGPPWVDDARAKVSQVQIDRPYAVRSPALMRLTQLGEHNHDAVMSLLRLVGQDVKTLHFADGFRPADSSCTQIFDACPQLESLSLRGNEVDGTALVTNSFSLGRCASLHQLYIVAKVLTENALLELPETLNVLANPSHPMTQQLEAFEFEAYSSTNDNHIVESDVLDIALHMLENNTRLTRLKFHLPLAVHDPAVVDHLKISFARHEDVMLPVPIAPLGHQEKVAFLSVVSTMASSAIAQFDRHIITMIFLLAPDRRRRFTDIKIPRVIPVEE